VGADGQLEFLEFLQLPSGCRPRALWYAGPGRLCGIIYEQKRAVGEIFSRPLLTAAQMTLEWWSSELTPALLAKKQLYASTSTNASTSTLSPFSSVSSLASASKSSQPSREALKTQLLGFFTNLEHGQDTNALPSSLLSPTPSLPPTPPLDNVQSARSPKAPERSSVASAFAGCGAVSSAERAAELTRSSAALFVQLARWRAQLEQPDLPCQQVAAAAACIASLAQAIATIEALSSPRSQKLYR
jgi:hypothetical protein